MPSAYFQGIFDEQRKVDALVAQLRFRELGAVELERGRELSLAIGSDPELAPFALTAASLEYARAVWARLPESTKLVCDAGVLVTAGAISLAGLRYGSQLPDLDIGLIGIGRHRFWVLHSAIAARVAQDFLERVTLAQAGDRLNPAVVKLTSAVVAGGAVGIGIHLLKDGAFGLLDGHQRVVFGVPGLMTRNTLIRGTYIDDDLWLLGNSLWAFKIASDVIVLAYGENFDAVRGWVKDRFGRTRPDVGADSEVL